MVRNDLTASWWQEKGGEERKEGGKRILNYFAEFLRFTGMVCFFIAVFIVLRKARSFHSISESSESFKISIFASVEESFYFLGKVFKLLPYRNVSLLPHPALNTQCLCG